MAVAGDGPGWGRNNNMVRASATGDHPGREQPRSVAADYARATMPPQPAPAQSYQPDMSRPATAASRYGAAPRPAQAARPYGDDAYYVPPQVDPYAPPADPYGDAQADPYATYPEPAADPVPAAAPPTRVAMMATNVSRWTRYAGAAASVALVLGVAWWSYQLLMRDVNGVPVVKAMEGPMRIAPENPGGELSADIGLAVNAIAALGAAAPPEEELALAPVSTRLTEEDLSVAVQPLDEGQEPAPALIVTEDDFSAFDTAPPPTAPAAQPAAEAVPEEAAPEDPAVEETPAETQAVVADIPAAPERPRSRPTALNTAPAPAAATTATVSGPLPSGTPLVQFGAYDSLALAAGEWDRLSGRFAGLMAGKSRVIQEAASGGRTFFRLRATGFGDLADARRFCSAMVAEGAECIPTIEP